MILTQGSELRVPLKELKRSSVVSTSGSTFEEAERQAIVEALKTAQGKIWDKAAQRSSWDSNAQRCRTRCASLELRACQRNFLPTKVRIDV